MNNQAGNQPTTEVSVIAEWTHKGASKAYIEIVAGFRRVRGYAAKPVGKQRQVCIRWTGRHSESVSQIFAASWADLIAKVDQEAKEKTAQGYRATGINAMPTFINSAWAV